MKSILAIILFLLSVNIFSQSLDELESYTVDEFYKKIDLEYGTLDEDGNNIREIYVPTDIDLQSGKYEIQLSDGPSDLYEILNTDLYISFIGYYGYAGYSDDCILEIGYYNSATVYKLE